MPFYCCVPLCTASGNFKFPKDLNLQRKWCQAIRREGKNRCLWKPTLYSRICGNHFLESDFLPLAEQIGQRVHRRLRAEAVPSVFAFNKRKDKTSREERYQLRTEKTNPCLDGTKSFEVSTDDSLIDPPVAETITLSTTPTSPLTSSRNTSDASPSPATETNVGNEEWVESTGDMFSREIGVQAVPESVDKETQASQIHSGTQKYGIELFADDPNAIEFYTGFINFQHFNFFFSCLGPAAEDLIYQCQVLSRRDELFLTLMKLRRAKEDEELAILFKLTKKTVGKVFHTWLNFMYYQVQLKSSSGQIYLIFWEKNPAHGLQ